MQPLGPFVAPGQYLICGPYLTDSNLRAEQIYRICKTASCDILYKLSVCFTEYHSSIVNILNSTSPGLINVTARYVYWCREPTTPNSQS